MILADAGATEALGRGLALAIREQAAAAGGGGPGAMLVFLEGPLGAGKTTLARGLLRALGVTGTIRSPTYTLVEVYPGAQVPACHLDLYRLADPEELEMLGIRDYLAEMGLCMVEWPERGAGFLPVADLTARLAHAGARRAATLSASTARGTEIVARCTEFC